MASPEGTPPPGGGPVQVITSTVLSIVTSIPSATATSSFAESTAASVNGAVPTVEASTTNEVPLQVTNSFSLVACLLVIGAYFFFRRQNQRIMERPSLVLAVSMATADAVLHAVNLFGYADLKGFSCAFWGGFFYAFPTLISIFYSFCIALNTQLVFVFSKRPGFTTLKYYVFIPIIVSAFICIPALSAGVYGYDASYDLCWYASDGTHQHKVVVRYILTFGMWCLSVMVYLIIAAMTIIWAVFSKTSKMNQLATTLSRSLGSSAPRTPSASGPHTLPKISVRPSSGHAKYTVPEDIGVGNNQPTHFYTPTQSAIGGAAFNKSEFDSEPVTPMTPVKLHPRYKRPYSTTQSGGSVSAAAQHPSGTLSRRSLAMRALALRLLGYILIPTICILPGVIQDFLSKVSPQTAAGVPDSVTTMLDTLNGLVGLFNAILFSLDPALLALYHQMRMERREKKSMGRQAHRDIEMAPTGTVYTTPPESPGSKSPRQSHSDGAEGSSADRHHGRGGPNAVHETQTFVTAEGESDSAGVSQTDLGNGTKVEVRTGKFLAPILVGNRFKKSERGLPSPRSIASYGNGGAALSSPGIVIQVEVEVDTTRDKDIERLERYLGGL
ncbi:SubName: Full=Uncharacterized protein {ECO:0000313/EMBL:CCA70837.1} [Serendipita indica DSM 11827]|uniref:G-protein coupled receptors family 2 profile 2 domain-containing protein n=1 Tax=Serendipita indica (strain DSM 11827) TaxID=1109443 RepID=G4THP1_SERID|nr:SubName: Full=Uncharacterized protein {ECO:0000313/EMBL:CCA70837.1} [Serendipita indica DSM 11827]CCA70837.1 hypothetical protein PIIN_04772 [Serendipita indica DSM 11827]